MLWLAKWRGEWGARRGRVGEGEARAHAGATERHPTVAVVRRRPRGDRGLTPVGHGVRAGEWASERGGRPGRLVLLGRKGGGSLLSENVIFFLFIFLSKFIQMKF